MQLKTLSPKIVLAVCGTYPVRSEVGINDNEEEQFIRFSYLGNEVTYNYIPDFQHKLSEFQTVCGLILRTMNK
jgi:hypothetical protein